MLNARSAISGLIITALGISALQACSGGSGDGNRNQAKGGSTSGGTTVSSGGATPTGGTSSSKTDTAGVGGASGGASSGASGSGGSVTNSGGAAPSGGSSAGGSGPAGGKSATDCTADRECRDSNRLCHPTQGKCTDCVLDSDCKDSKVCRFGSCLAAKSCTSNLECPTNMSCDTELSKICVECLSASDCGAAQGCVDHVCRPSCTTDQDCRGPFTRCFGSPRYCVGVCSGRAGARSCNGTDVVTCKPTGGSFEITESCGPRGCQLTDTGALCGDGDGGVAGAGGAGGMGAGGATAGAAPLGGTAGTGQGGEGGAGSPGVGGFDCRPADGAANSLCTSIPRFVGTQLVDGKSDDFCLVPGVTYDLTNAPWTDQQQTQPDAAAPGSPLAVTVRAGWDDRALHLHVHVKDSLIKPSGDISNRWNGDSVEIFLGPSAAALTGPVTGSFGTGTHIIIAPPTGDQDASTKGEGSFYNSSSEIVSLDDVDAIRWNTRLVEDGYEIELRHPWSSDGRTTIEPNTQVGFYLVVNQSDTGSGRVISTGLLPKAAGKSVEGCDPQLPWCNSTTWCTPSLQP